VEPRAGLDMEARRKIPRHCREPNPGRPARSLELGIRGSH